MRSTKVFLAFLYCLNTVGAFHGVDRSGVSKQHRNGETTTSAKQKGRSRSLSNIMMPGERVSAMENKDSAICSAKRDPNLRAAINPTSINYYYAIESTSELVIDSLEGRATVRMLEDKLFRAIRPAILWCYFEEPPSPGRNLLSNGMSSLQGMGVFHPFCSADELYGSIGFPWIFLTIFQSQNVLRWRFGKRRQLSKTNSRGSQTPNYRKFLKHS